MSGVEAIVLVSGQFFAWLTMETQARYRSRNASPDNPVPGPVLVPTPSKPGTGEASPPECPGP